MCTVKMNLISTSVVLHCDLIRPCSETKDRMGSRMNSSLYLRTDHSVHQMQGSWLPRSLNDVLLMVLCI